MNPPPIDFAVRREAFHHYFEPQIGKSTFYDLVNSGKIAKVKGLRGYYRLNESLRRLGLPAVDQLRRTEESPVILEGIALVDIALSICMPDELLLSSELLIRELTSDEEAKVVQLCQIYDHRLSEIANPAERLRFAQGVRDAAMMLGADPVKPEI